MSGTRLCATAIILAGLLLGGCSKKQPDSNAGAGAGDPAGKTVTSTKKEPETKAPALFGDLAAHLCDPGRIPELLAGTVEFSTRLRNTDLMLDLQDKTLEQALQDAQADMDELAQVLKQDLAEHPLETCAVAEEKIPCDTAAQDMAMGGGAMFTESSVTDVLHAMEVSECGTLTAQFKFAEREPESQVFLAGKTRGQWRLLTEMPEMR